MKRWFFALAFLVVGAVAGGLLTGSILRGQNGDGVTVQGPVGQTGLPKDLASYSPVVKRVLPAVVSIESKTKPRKVKAQQPNSRRRAPLDDQQLPDELRKFMEEFGRGPLEMPDEGPHVGFGSGFIVDPKGVILTNYHVVDGADQVEITLTDGRKFPSKEVHADPKSDLAIVRIEAKAPLAFLELGDSDAMEIGDRVLAVGAPFGLTGTVTAGIVSAKGRSGLRMNLYEDFLQTDAAINPGNSGGPLLNLEGKVIGINSAIKSRSGGFQGVGLAISSNMAKNVMEQLLKTGSVRRGYLGVQIKDLDDPDLAARLGVKGQGGVVVGQIFEGTPAAKGGLKEGDVITTVGGKAIKNGRELQRMVASLTPGKPVAVTVVREGKTQELSVTVEEQPAEFGTAAVPTPRRGTTSRESVKLDKLGIQVADLTPETAEELGYKEDDKGVVITRVEEDSPAAEKGLRRGMLIVRVDQKPVRSVSDLQRHVEKGVPDNGVLFKVRTPAGASDLVVVKPTESAKQQ